MATARTVAPWWDVMRLRPEVADGAANEVRMSLHDAAFGPKGTDTSVAYADPAYYGEITYPSPSLVALMSRIAIRLRGPAAASQTAVWRLAQAMGGGKSHALIGLWHLATQPDQLHRTDLGQQIAASAADIAGKGWASGGVGSPVCVVLDCDNTSAGEEDFGPARSLGERFLWRLFATDYGCYTAFKDHTANKAKLAEALRTVEGPVLVLVDEVMDYIRVAAADNTDEAAKDMAFLRALLDVVNTVDRCAVVIVMIATEDDDMALTGAGTDMRRELEALLTRNASTTAVTSGGDFAQIIQRRLFEQPPPQDTVASTSRLFNAAAHGAWQDKAFSKLGDYSEPAFAKQLRRSYPFHPELIDLAENEWSKHSGFQKVRSTIRVFAAAAAEQATRGRTGKWAPLLIGSGDLPLGSAVVRDALLNSGLVADDRTQTNLREVAATDIADPHHLDRGTARSIDTGRDQRIGWVRSNPHAAERIATAMFVRSLCPRPTGERGATEAELCAASFVPDAGYTLGDAESVLQRLEPPDGLMSVDFSAGQGKAVPKRWFFETRNTLAMLTRAAKQSVSTADRDAAITARAFDLASHSSGPFDRVICVDGGPAPDHGADTQDCIKVLQAAGIDNRHQTRLVILDSRWFSLFNGNDTPTREALTAAMGLGPDALSFAWASSAVFACAHTALRAQARGVASEWLACQRVAEMDSVRNDPDMNTRARQQEREALTELDKRVRLCYKHIVYLAPTDEHDRKAGFRRIQQDNLTALSGADVWTELRQMSKAARLDEFDARMLQANLQANDYGRPLCEIRDSFWDNPHKPLLAAGETELAAAIYEAVAAGDIELVDSNGDLYRANNASDVNLASKVLRLRRVACEICGEPARRCQGHPVCDTCSQPAAACTCPPVVTTPAGPQPDIELDDGTQGPSEEHWTASININTGIDPDVGNEEIIQLLRALMLAAADGEITHINQLTNITITGSQEVADKIKSFADQAQAEIDLRRL